MLCAIVPLPTLRGSCTVCRKDRVKRCYLWNGQIRDSTVCSWIVGRTRGSSVTLISWTVKEMTGELYFRLSKFC